jgi:hypothetical protein
LESTDEKSLSAEPKKYVIYCESGACELVIKEQNSGEEQNSDEEQDSDNVTFQSAEKKVFSLADEVYISKPSDADDQIVLNLMGQTYSLSYFTTMEGKLSSYYCTYNEYQSDDRKINLQTRASTNEILLFYVLGNHDTTGDITEGEAKNIADSLLPSLYGENVLQEYTYEYTHYVESSSWYAVSYRKYVWDTPTNDHITVGVNLQGEVWYVWARYLGMFSDAENQITRQDIDDSLSILYDKFSDNWSIGATYLTIDSEGDYYIDAYLARDVFDGEEKVIEPLEVFINVSNVS